MLMNIIVYVEGWGWGWGKGVSNVKICRIIERNKEKQNKKEYKT